MARLTRDAEAAAEGRPRAECHAKLSLVHTKLGLHTGMDGFLSGAAAAVAADAMFFGGYVLRARGKAQAGKFREALEDLELARDLASSEGCLPRADEAPFFLSKFLQQVQSDMYSR